MTKLLLTVPAHNVLEFREILTEAEIDFKINRDRTHKFDDPVIFEISVTSETETFARRALAEMDTYITNVVVKAGDIDETIELIDSLGLEINSVKVEIRILDKPFTHKIEVKGEEQTLWLLRSKIAPSLIESKFDRAANKLVITPSRGGSGKGTISYMGDIIDHDIQNARI